jgi:hypothetical protein
MGVTPNHYNLLDVLQSSSSSAENMMMDEIPLPPTYLPPETQAMDATLYYVVAGMSMVAAAFGNLILVNFVSVLTCLIVVSHLKLPLFQINQ